MTWMIQRLVGPQTAAAMTLFGQVLDADAAVAKGLALAKADDVVAAAVELAQASVKAPRELVVATKRTLRTTAAYDRHDDAVETELVAQVASMETPRVRRAARRDAGSDIPAGVTGCPTMREPTL